MRGGEKIKSKLPYNTFSDQSSILLEERDSLEGVLESVQPYGDGLIQIQMWGKSWLVGEELESDLMQMIGQQVSILRLEGWSARRMP